ncbi:MAG TPA: GIY-YIG nuclease family protein [Balneolales bacterium]|nr:GIY-YIG nuclease family protein [Balneolales bacterium]
MYYVYILYSRSRDRFYTGQTDDVGDRFIRHNQGRSKATKSGRPWLLAYAESYPTRSEAMRREKEIKGKKSREYIIELIKNYEP